MEQRVGAVGLRTTHHRRDSIRMVKVYLGRVQPTTDDKRVQRSNEQNFCRFTRLAERSHNHDLVENASDADIILLYASFTLFFGHIDRNRVCLRRNPFA